MPMPTATSATAIELRAPTMMRESTSRPKWSVPNQCAADGGFSFCAMAISVTGYGVQTSETSGHGDQQQAEHAADHEAVYGARRGGEELAASAICSSLDLGRGSTST